MNEERGSDPVVADESPEGAGEPERAERVAAMLAVLSFGFCSLVGQLLVLWWARRHGSLFVRRYAWASLALEGVVLAMMVPTGVVFALVMWEVVSGGFMLALMLAAQVVQGVLVVFSWVLAVRAWRGRDVTDGRGMDWVARWLPSPDPSPLELDTIGEK